MARLRLVLIALAMLGMAATTPVLASNSAIWGTRSSSTTYSYDGVPRASPREQLPALAAPVAYRTRAQTGQAGRVAATVFAAKEGSNVAYRVIRPDEDPEAGLVAKNPDATYTPEGHVLNGSRPGFASQYISGTTDLNVAQKWAALTGNRIVGINLDMVDSPIIDLSTIEGRAMYLNGVTARNFAAACL